MKVWSDEKDIGILYKGFEILKKEKNFSDGIRQLKFSKGRWMTQLIITDYLALNENGTINISKTALNITEYLKELLKLDNKLKNLVNKNIKMDFCSSAVNPFFLNYLFSFINFW